MLGTGLGKKVDAQFVKNAYNSFLRKEEPPRRPRTQEERREECRRKGIFVAADDDEMQPTTFEQPAVASRPANFRNAPKPLKWKKPSTVKAQNTKPETRKSANTSANGKAAQKTPPTTQHGVKQMRRRDSKGPKKDPEMETAKPLPPVMLEPVVAASPKRKPSDPPSDNSLRLGKKSSDVSMKLDKTQREDLSQRSEKRETKQPPSDHVVEDAVAMAMAMAVELKTDEAKKILDAETKPEEKDRVKKEKSAPLGEIEVLAKTPEQGSYTLREPVHSPSTGGIRCEKEAAFAKLDDDEFEKVLEQENARCAETDKNAVKAARKILKTAYKEKVLDKVLTKEENEILVKFFSGKIPYDQKVLQILDRALDKTIDWLETRRIKVSAETAELIAQRASLKRALFAEFLINPQYMPRTWAKKYEELRQQSRLETAGINWARVLLCYPTQKSFGDGPMDEFGNFTRRKRHWLLAMLLGPADSKTFAETQREEACRGMYFDSVIMEKAKSSGAAGEDKDTSTTASTTNSVV